MKVILTGASGFVGSYVLGELLKQNIGVALVLRESSDVSRIASMLDQCQVFKSDLSCIDSIREELSNFKPDCLMHLAWAGVTNNHRNDLSQIQVNISQAQQLFELAKDVGVKTIIGVGSQAEYGPTNQVLSETDETMPTTLYGVAKLSVCHMLRCLCLQNDIRFVWHRIFSTYGPKDHASWFIPMLVLKLMCGESPDITPGTQRWDYVYVEDVAKAIVATLTADHANGIFNIGSGEAYTIKTIAETLLDMVNPELSLGIGRVPFRPDQVMFLQADITKLKEVVGWEPQVSLQQGLTKTVEWYKTDEHTVTS